MDKVYRKTNFVLQMIYITVLFLGVFGATVTYTRTAVNMMQELHSSAVEVSEETLTSFLLGGVGIFEIGTSFVLLVFLLCACTMLYLFAIMSYSLYDKNHVPLMTAMDILYIIFCLLTCGILFGVSNITKIWSAFGFLTICIVLFNLVMLIKFNKKTEDKEEKKQEIKKDDKSQKKKTKV